MPTKSVWARVLSASGGSFAAANFAASAAEAAASVACGEVAPKTGGMWIELLASSKVAVPTPPTLHPARVKGTHGAGAFLPCAVSMLVVRSVTAAPVGSNSGAVQYANETPVLVLPVGR